jgi:hypothetical protein
MKVGKTSGCNFVSWAKSPRFKASRQKPLLALCGCPLTEDKKIGEHGPACVVDLSGVAAIVSMYATNMCNFENF